MLLIEVPLFDILLYHNTWKILFWSGPQKSDPLFSYL